MTDLDCLRMGMGLSKSGEHLRRSANIPGYFIPDTAALQQTVLIPDVSFYQEDHVNFAQMKVDGCAGVIIRSGQNLWEDRQFKSNWAKAKAAGLPRGTYFFLDSRVKGSQQADLLHSLLKDDPPELMIVGDFEENYGGPYAGWNLPYDFFERMKSYGWRADKLWLYTGYYYWLDHKPREQSALNYFKQYELWEAWYTHNAAAVLCPPPWEKISLWQYTDNSPYGGDLSWYNGTLDEFKARFHLDGGEPPEPPTGDDMNYVGTLLAAALNVRAEPSATATILGAGYLKCGDLVLASAIENDRWWKLKGIRRGGNTIALPAETCYAYEGDTGGYIRQEFEVVAEETPEPVKPTINLAISGDGYPDVSVEWKPSA